jgi:hypothetical protein
MRIPLKKMIDIASSLTTGLVVLFTLLLFMIVGSITMLKTGGYETINSMPLFIWIRKTSLSNSWWLILSLLSLIVITINTILCTIRSLISKVPARSFLLKISPQIIHAGFLFILLAHLFSSTDSFHFVTNIYEKQGIQLDDTTVARFTDIKLSTTKTGFPTGMHAKVTIYNNRDEIFSQKISPNHPAFYNHLGFYLKNIRPYPYPNALIEISRDSGAVWALAGGVLFFIGNTLLVVLRWRHESAKNQNAESPP